MFLSPNTEQMWTTVQGLIMSTSQCIWQALTMMSCSKINMGANTSEYSWLPCPESFWQRRNLNTNSNTRNKKLQDARNRATLYAPSSCIRINTIVQKYAFSPSPANRGANTIHHALAPVRTSSTRSAKRIVKSAMARRFIQISNTVSPSHCTNSFNVKNMSIAPAHIPVSSMSSMQSCSVHTDVDRRVLTCVCLILSLIIYWLQVICRHTSSLYMHIISFHDASSKGKY